MLATLSHPTAQPQILTVRADLVQRFLKHSGFNTKFTTSDLIQIATDERGRICFRRTDGVGTAVMETSAAAGRFTGIFHIDDLNCLKDADSDGPISFYNERIKYYCCGAPVERKVECRPPEAFCDEVFTREYAWSKGDFWRPDVLSRLREIHGCASDDKDREAIAGIRIQPDGVAVATDGRLMTVCDTLPGGLVELATTFSWLPPIALAKEAVVFLGFNVPPRDATHEEREKWVYRTTHIRWVIDWPAATFEKVEEAIMQNFPDWKSIETSILEAQCGATTSVQLPFSLKEMLKKVTSKVKARDRKDASITLSADGVGIKLTTPDAEISIGGSWAGENPDWFISFHPEIISAALALDHYRMSITDERSPGLFTPIGTRGEHTIVMPMRVPPRNASSDTAKAA